MAYGVVVPVAIAATNVDAWVRSAVHATLPIENGSVFSLLTKSTTSGESEVWTAIVPTASTTTLTQVWMACEPEIVWTGSYRGLDPDVRNQLHDLFLMSEDCFEGTKASVSYTHVNCTDTYWQLVWGTSQTGSVLSMKYIATQYISIGMGTIDSNRLTAYLMEVVGL
jgi:hypothetical protein